ncbi:MAG TPA: nucleotide disphospho-sugar-binding domain-containing protein, partial [Pirellulales bacterium]|nr:nucleotide disphospho-sugar-binding domain-containing protein [Pirellulales bacterium]
SAGDVHPFVGIGLALARRGYKITLVAAGYFEQLAKNVGFDFAPIFNSDEFLALLKNPLAWHRFRGFIECFRGGVLPTFEPIYRAIADRYASGETVVVASTLAFGARCAQEKLGLPLVTVHLSPSVFRSDYHNPVLPGMYLPHWLPAPLKRSQYWLADTLVIERLIRGPLNEFRASIGLGPVRGILAHWHHSPERVLGLFPDWFGEPQPDWPEQTVLADFPLYDERDVSPLDDQLLTFLDSGEPPLVFTPGSAMLHGREFFSAAAEACMLLGRRGILLTRFAEQVPGHLPSGVRHFPYAPFSQLLPRAAALVHHGGIGTLSQGFAAGVPQLVMPMSFDQPDNAARLQRLGAGMAIPPKRFQAARVAGILQRLLASRDVARRCDEIADKMEQRRGLETACDVIEQAINIA